MNSIPLISQAINTAMLLVLVAGLLKRRQPRVHIPLMLVAFIGDLINVVIVEVYARSHGSGEGAVEQGLGFAQGEGTSLQLFHISVATLCLVGYVVALVTGTRLYRTGRGRKAHKINAGLFIVMRLATYVTSFWM